jgi:RNA polymerase I-specific transcription initiation factor RRN6
MEALMAVSLLLRGKENQTFVRFRDHNAKRSSRLEIARNLREDAETDSMDPSAFEKAIQGLMADVNDQVLLLDLEAKAQKDAERRSLESEITKITQSYTALWLDPIRDKLDEVEVQSRSASVAELARDVYLATRGVVIQDVPLFGELPTVPSRQQSREVRSSSIAIKSSQPSSPNISSSPPVPSTPEHDAVFQRLELLAPGIKPGKLGTLKEAAVLSYWPKERGIDTQNYVSSVAIASEEKFDGARQRVRQREMKRKALAEKYKLPEFLKQGESSASKSRQRESLSTIPIRTAAPMQIMSSQQGPASSQSQGFADVTMSQPVSGAFGDRKKSKKPKKKSGFR